MARLADSVVALCGRLSSLILVLVATIVVADVVLRYVFGAPTLWSVEFTGYGIAWLALLGAADVFAADQHVRVAVLLERLSEGQRRVLQRLGDAVVLAVAVILAVASALWAHNAYAIGEISDTVLQTPQALVRIAFPVGMAMLALAAALRLAGIRRPEEGRWSS